jgi:predicted  nucleic acid-binding Zn-ribbon protein
MSGTAPLAEVADLCRQVEMVNSTLREIDTKLKQLRQDAASMAVGAELHRRRGELTTQVEHLQKRRGDLEIEVNSLDALSKELKREETNQTALANKAKKGQTLVSLAARYREAAGEIRNRAAEQLRKNISEHVG